MTGLQSVLELIMFLSILAGVVYEDKLIELEEIMWWILCHPIKTIKNIISYILKR